METELVYLEARVHALIGRLHELQRDNATLHEALLANKEAHAHLESEYQALQEQALRMEEDKQTLRNIIAQSAEDIRELMKRLPVSEAIDVKENVE